jgi:DNA ligase-associated metallophosphoesterase
MTGQRVCIEGEELLLLPEKAAYWTAERSLFVADVHLGKGAAFRALSVPVPAGSSECTLQRLSEIVSRTGAERVVILGDLWHAKEGRSEINLQLLKVWRQQHSACEVVLVEGNHDRRSGALPPDLGIAEVGEGECCAPFVLRHYPEPADNGYVLSGHIHPAVRLTGRGRQALSLPCFWFGERVGVLPSFGDFTGFARVEPLPGDKVFVIAESRVFAAN